MNLIATQTKFLPFTLKHAQVVTNLVNANARNLFGHDKTTVDEMLNDWKAPGFCPEEVARVVVNQLGQVIGYVDIWDTSDPHVIKYMYAVLHPDHWSETVFDQMVAWGEDCAQSRVNLAPEGAQVLINIGLSHQDRRRKTALELRSFALVRHFFQMEISLDEIIESTAVPAGLTITPIDMNSEFEKTVMVMDEAFQDHWGHVSKPETQLLADWRHYIAHDQDFDPTLWFLARDGKEIAGVCRCSPKTVENPDMGWINQLCVRKAWRCRGLGSALLKHAFHTFKQRGKSKAGLGVDASSLTKATRLYENAGMQVTRQYDTYEKELRPGKRLRRE